MNEIIEAVILGIIQGLTEFLPVSSSGHLELAKWIMGDQASAEESFLMTVVLHFGTALSTVWVFRKMIFKMITNIANKEGQRFILSVVVSMIPAAIIGVTLEPYISALFDRQIVLVSICLAITGIIMLLSDRVKAQNQPLTVGRAFIIGIAQAIAILPGISRSGSTIFTGLQTGLGRVEAAQFSFIMVIPLIFGKMAKDAMDEGIVLNQGQLLPLCIGFVVSFIVGVLACTWMVSIVKAAKLKYFGYYCLIVSAIALIVWFT